MFSHFNASKIMGILNVTPDSFSDGGRYVDLDAALIQAEQLCSAGADIIDVGGESTRPGATPVSQTQELERVIPVIEAIKKRYPVTISVDTSQPVVMQEAVRAGATMINDVRALQIPQALETAASLNVPICLMHMQGDPTNMQENPGYLDFKGELKAFFSKRIAACESAGIARENLFLDPGFGFGKTVSHNLQMIKFLSEYQEFGLPILIGVSRKSTIGTVLDADVNDRLAGSLALAALSALQGASIIRCHDVKETKDVITLLKAVEQS